MSWKPLLPSTSVICSVSIRQLEPNSIQLRLSARNKGSCGCKLPDVTSSTNSLMMADSKTMCLSSTTNTGTFFAGESFRSHGGGFAKSMYRIRYGACLYSRVVTDRCTNGQSLKLINSRFTISRWPILPSMFRRNELIKQVGQSFVKALGVERIRKL